MLGLTRLGEQSATIWAGTKKGWRGELRSYDMPSSSGVDNIHDMML